ncbi:sterol desaturase/sphingolipid hydroxylase (fatty acid hydroxylase superfamily) [Sulfitobacter mediterraneus]|jgi:sterol desaturase/sphingolipid hydroxylase (fatty acid hydroxylase superfamily)|uniref:Sterol desaturase n=2 Tax=Sulfitobacter mediterraneus TaxID=83219 RepID=A0A061SU31_9RHOB|nr:sterol desaturase family protein [Sulfitobacter mediterraneus]KAJ02780.1 sterol desaturase [Sulfitobacter mediterraneus]KIN79291.1 Sterol desaturase-related protein [Sulfitobacter mediterraneus KCTC 32188]PTX72973.1 sterol desaturase/sphingolipid hydroxylase (fatty acid hydroxylase superfamily) [Sulfitobacter mediterraneus]
MQTGIDLLDRFIAHAMDIVMFPFDSQQRIFALYLACSVVIAFGIYLLARRRGAQTEGGFLRFLFPKHVWQHPSAWLDLRYFFFHRIFGHFFILGLGAWFTVLPYKYITGTDQVVAKALENVTPPLSELGQSLGFMVVAVIVADLIGYVAHYLQHKSVFLWQFHKVHHSAEVMHPVSNYREHPVDNLFYITLNGFGYGAILGLATLVYGFTPSLPTLLGVPAMHLLFNVAGYNLRHSHIWLKWPGKLSMIFPSPAHHHVHHSCHPDHIDRNFAFMLPIWDVIFGTYHMPEDNRDVKFGIGKEDKGEFTSCARLYWVPCRDAYRVVRRRLRRKNGQAQAAAPQTPNVPAE